jgi:hypothetical protein
MEDKNLLALEISRLKEIIKGLDGQRQLAVRTTLEIKAAERRGAERMFNTLSAIIEYSDQVRNQEPDFYNKAWDEWEKTQEK